jgi:hypothetical protein
MQQLVDDHNAYGPPLKSKQNAGFQLCDNVAHEEPQEEEKVYKGRGENKSEEGGVHIRTMKRTMKRLY